MSIAFLFPGQGSQVPGMFHSLPDHPAITRTLDEASASLHQDVRDLDSPEALKSTISVQLALLTAGVAAARALAEGRKPKPSQASPSERSPPRYTVASSPSPSRSNSYSKGRK